MTRKDLFTSMLSAYYRGSEEWFAEVSDIVDSLRADGYRPLEIFQKMIIEPSGPSKMMLSDTAVRFAEITFIKALDPTKVKERYHPGRNPTQMEMEM